MVTNPKTVVFFLRVGVMQKSRHQQWFFYSINPERKRAVKTFVDLFSDNVFSKDLQLYRDLRASGELIERDINWHTKKIVAG
jgi:hypothetical protein